MFTKRLRDTEIELVGANYVQGGKHNALGCVSAVDTFVLPCTVYFHVDVHMEGDIFYQSCYYYGWSFLLRLVIAFNLDSGT